MLAANGPTSAPMLTSLRASFDARFSSHEYAFTHVLIY